ncbi:MAG TPA: RagB/SusD family nutrient uptake outer membrane protein [Chitinophagaceae bacterium]|nr:RagB/SusD family nutrient uptake outer membrane protein [Chitinophagaceae bacterium]
MKNKLLYLFLASGIVTGISCSKSELDIKNPNQPTPDVSATEPGILSLAIGAIYQNGFAGISDSRYTGSFLGSNYFFLAPAYHDLMADVVSAEAANNITNQVGVPDYVILDDGTKITNSAPSKGVVRVNNSKTKAGLNMFYYEWTWLYFMNNACNGVLNVVDKTSFTGDSTSKKNAIKTWCYFWKGFVYAHIGSVYYAGLIKDDYNSLSNEYKSSADMIAASNANFDKAIAAAGAIPNAADFATVMKTIIPSQNQVGKGGVLTPAMWIHNINTMKARNLLVNKRLKDMTSSDWNNILTLTANGITSTDLVMTGRSAATNSYLSATGGSVAALTTGNPGSTTYKISERLIQDYPAGDKRLANDFITAPTYLNQKGGFTFSTRYRLLDSGGITKAYTAASITSKVVGAYELYMAGTYEENELMKAEANIKLGNIAAGLASVDAVRTYQGAGLAATSGVITDAALAYEELRKERRVGLIFRDVAFYDARRWGVLDDISAGGGRTKAVVVNPVTGAVNTNATINYNFLDYWDVPDDETALNVPSATSAPVKNPK